MKEEIGRREKEKWAEERKNIIKDLQNRVDRVIELEVALDDSKDSYKTLESYLSEGERALKRKTDTLERNLEQLTLMYHQLVSQKSHLQVEKQLADKKLGRMNEKIKVLEEENKQFKITFEEYEARFRQNADESSIYDKTRRGSIISGNIRKTIQGGNSNSKRPSLISKNPFNTDE
jgi:hypothetical protein